MSYFVKRIGEGKPVLFLPGTGWAGLTGLHIAEHLMLECCTYMVDLPGIGRSEGLDGKIDFKRMADWVKQFLDDYKIPKISLIGHSLGGAMALAFASYYPERVVSLTLLDIGHQRIPRFPTDMFGNIGYFVPIIDVLEKLFGRKVLGEENDEYEQSQQTRPAADIEQKIAEVCKKKNYQLSDQSYLRKALEYPVGATNAGISLLLAIYRIPLPKKLKRSDPPCCLIYGTYPDADEKRRQKIEKTIRQLMKKRPDINVVPVESGHYVHWEDERTAGVVRDFVLQHITK